MVHSVLPISVLFYGKDGTHLFALTTARSAPMQLQSVAAKLSKAEGVARPRPDAKETQMTQRMNWRSFENSLKTEARFFSRTAANHLTSIFDGIGELQTREGRPLVVDAGPGTDLHTLYRARVFQSDDKLETALGRPDIHLGSPPAPLTPAGRINARGIPVFYGANTRKAAIAEVRPPVGSQVAVAKFEIIRKLRLLDLTALSDISVTASIVDFGFAGRMEDAVFLRSLSARLTRPVMPDDETSNTSQPRPSPISLRRRLRCRSTASFFRQCRPPEPFSTSCFFTRQPVSRPSTFPRERRSARVPAAGPRVAGAGLRGA